MSSKSTIGEFYEPAAEEISMEALDTSCVPPDASSAAMVANSKEDSVRPTLMEDVSCLMRLLNHVPMTNLIKGY
eukprot:scaffold11765_cov78-Skeletonema_marinoi.AAC.3